MNDKTNNKIKQRLYKLSIKQIDIIYDKINSSTKLNGRNTSKSEKIDVLLEPLRNTKQTNKLSKRCKKSIRNISKSFTRKRIKKFFDQHINKHELEYAMSCAGKDRVKKEVEKVIYQNKIHEKKWKQEIDRQIKKYLKDGFI